MYTEMTLTIDSLTNFGMLFPVVCFMFVFDQTLAEHLYCDKALFIFDPPEIKSGSQMVHSAKQKQKQQYICITNGRKFTIINGEKIKNLNYTTGYLNSKG